MYWKALTKKRFITSLLNSLFYYSYFLPPTPPSSTLHTLLHLCKCLLQLILT